MTVHKIHLLSPTMNKRLIKKADSSLNNVKVSLLKHDEYFGDDYRGMEEGICIGAVHKRITRHRLWTNKG